MPQLGYTAADLGVGKVIMIVHMYRCSGISVQHWALYGVVMFVGMIGILMFAVTLHVYVPSMG